MDVSLSPPRVGATKEPRAPAGVATGVLLRRLFLAVLCVYLLTAGSNFTSGDAYAELRVARGLVEHGWFAEPRVAACRPGSGYGEPGIDGRCYAPHAIGYSLTLIPFYLLARAAIALFGFPYNDAWTTFIPYVPIQLLSWNTCLWSAATVTLLCRLCLDLGYGARRALGVALLYAFATLAWPYARFGFDVTPTAFCVLAAMRWGVLAGGVGEGVEGSYVYEQQKRRATWLWRGAGIFAALAVLIRMPTLAALVPLAAYAILAQRGRSPLAAVGNLVAFATPILAVGAWTAWYDWVRFGGIFNDGHAHNVADQIVLRPWVGLGGMLISPGKGLLWYSPLMVLALLAMPPFYRRHRRVCLLALSVAGASLVPYIFVRDWYGGDAWGPRFLLPVLPLLALPLAELPTLLAGRKGHAVPAGALIAVSTLLALAGQVVSYPERLRLAARAGLGDRLFWDPRYSPLGDHVAALWSYLRHPHYAAETFPPHESFDIWWLDLWRVHQVPAGPTLVAAGLLALATTVAIARLCLLLPRLAN